MKENQPKRGDQGSHHGLPQVILEEIIVRLPEKSSVRFTSVCKEWFNIICGLGLDLAELNFRQTRSKINIFYKISNDRYWDADRYRLFKLDEKGLGAKEVATLRLENVSKMESACKGLLLLELEGNPPGGAKWLVYDTVSHRQKLLPEIDGLHRRKRFCTTMVYDASNRKYKVIVFLDDVFRGMKLLFYNLTSSQEWCREERKLGEWRQSKPPLAQIIGQHSPVVVQGVLYWVAQPPEPEHNVVERRFAGDCFIQPMEIATEKFMKRIEAPCQPHHRPGPPGVDFYRLLEVKGCLGLLTVNSVSGLRFSAGDELYIWVMKDSWIKQYTIALSSMERKVAPLLKYGFLHYCNFHPRLTLHNYMLVTIGLDDNLFWYNMATEELSEVAMQTDAYSSYRHPLRDIKTSIPFYNTPYRCRSIFSITR